MRPPVAAWRAALAGAVAVAVALAVIELVAATTPLVPSAIDAVSQQVIPYSPERVTRWAIRTFGTSDIAVLNAGTTTIAVLFGAATGLAARRGTGRAIVIFVLFGGLGLVASLARSESSFPLVVVTLTAAVAAGLVLLAWLLRLAAPPPTRTPTPTPSHLEAGAAPVVAEVDGADPTRPRSTDRRRFLLATGGSVAAAALAVGVGRFSLRDRLAVVDPREVALPSPARSLASAPTAASFDVDGLTPLFVPNDRFYVIDTAVAVPQVDPSTWSMRIHGLVDRELELTYDDLLDLPMEEFDVTISCVSNEVGGDLVGNARWLGTRLDALLERVGVQPDAAQVMGRSTDGFTAGFPIEAARDGRDTIVAIGMNGDPLPTRHGFPARLIVPGLYGYVSATKWLAEIELTTWDVDGYWIPRGWSKEGPVLTQSRIDVPRRGASEPAGEVVVAGIAWAPTRGIERVEIALDGGAWLEADLSEPLSDDAWVQWRVTVDVPPGDHVVQVRATDGGGEVQTRSPAPPAPSGATGWDRVTFRTA